MEFVTYDATKDLRKQFYVIVLNFGCFRYTMSCGFSSTVSASWHADDLKWCLDNLGYTPSTTIKVNKGQRSLVLQFDNKEDETLFVIRYPSEEYTAQS